MKEKQILRHIIFSSSWTEKKTPVMVKINIYSVEVVVTIAAFYLTFAGSGSQ